MKASLRNQVLMLSLASLAIIGTGCERRGRAPVKASAAVAGDVQSNDQKTGQNTATLTPETEVALKGNTSDAKPASSASSSVTSEEKDLISKAGLEVKDGKACEISIDTNEAPTSATLAKDFVSINKLYKCNENNGVQFYYSKDADGVSITRVDSSPIRGDQKSKMLIEYDRLIAGSNHDAAVSKLGARMDLYKMYLDRLVDKYAPSKMSSSTTYSYTDEKGNLNDKLTAGSALIAFSDQGKAIDAAKADLSKLQAIDNGNDVSRAADAPAAASPAASADANE